ncbi:MAG: pilus assembly protein [Desulfuromonadales bacterium]|nr:pilus assembly protein [Desulfuromonadales bacterium]
MGKKSLKKREKGAAAVEFAILLPLLLLLIAGIIEYGLVMFNKQVITNASREAARAGIVIAADGSRMSDANIVNVALNYCQNLLVTFDPALPGPTVDTPSSPDGQDSGDPLIITVHYRYTFLFLPNLSALFGSSAPSDLNLVAQTTMRYE